MKIRPEITNIQGDMAEGRLSLTGYLGDDRRNYDAIIQEDENTLQDLGVTAKEIGHKMRTLTLKGMENVEDFVEFDGFQIEVTEYKGWIPCPFKDNRKAGKRLTDVTDLKTGQHMSWTDLSIHLIRDHSFFQGKGAHFRLEPQELAEFLRLTK